MILKTNIFEELNNQQRVLKERLRFVFFSFISRNVEIILYFCFEILIKERIPLSS